MAVKFTNNAATTLAAGINSSVTSISVTDGSVFPALTGSDHFYVTFDDTTNREIVKVTARSGNTLTVVRGQDNTTAQAFNSGDKAELRVVAALLEDITTEVTSTLSVDTFTGDGTTTAFTLSQAPSSEDNLIVFIEGAYQNPGDFVLSGTTLTLDEAPVVDRNIIVYHVKGAVSGNNLNQDSFTADGNTAAFTLSIAPIHENNTQVFIDGVYQQKNSYSISGTTLTLDANPSNGATVEVMTFTQTEVNTLPASFVSGLTEVTAVGADHFMIFDATDSALKKSLVSDVLESATSISTSADATAITIDSSENVTFTNNVTINSGQLTAGGLAYPTSDGTNGQVLTTDGAGTLSFSTVSGTTINNNADNRIITGSGTANTLEGEANFVYDGANVGIGTTSPAEDLHVSGTGDKNIAVESTNTGAGANAGIKILAADGGDFLWQTGNATGNALRLYDLNANAERMRIDSAGDVLIGQTSQTGYAFAQKLVVGDGDNNDGITIQSGSTHQGNLAFNHSDGTTAHGRISYQHNTNYMSFFTNNAERMRLNNAGDAHIGLNDNDIQLFLGSVGGAFGNNSTNNVRASGSNLMLNTPGQFIVEKSGSLGLLMDTDKTFYVRPATSSDNFGMYVRTSNSADTGIKIGRTGTNNAEMGIKVASNGSNSFASFKFAISDATSWSSDDWFKLKVSGEMDGNFNDTSDRNLKENIVSIPNGDLAKVMQLNPVTFDWKNEVSRNDQTGFIAQEVETIFPNEVLGDAYDVEVEGSGKSINTIGILAHAVKAIQEQQTIIEDLKARIETLENA